MDGSHFQSLLNPTFLFLCFYVLTAIWIYYDATKHNIGKLNDFEEKKLMMSSSGDKFAEERQNDRFTLNMTAGMWAFGTMLAGVVGSMFISFPSDTLKGGHNSRYGLLGIFIMLSIPFTYLWHRPYLIKRAETAPVTIGMLQRTVSLGIFCAMGGFIVLAYIKAH